jgi:hypothetical protein
VPRTLPLPSVVAPLLAAVGCAAPDPIGDTAAAPLVPVEVAGAGFGDYDALLVGVAAFLPDDGSGRGEWLVGSKIGAVTSGAFDLAVGEADAGSTVVVDLWFDVNGTSACEAPPEDHGWRLGPFAVDDGVIALSPPADEFAWGVCGSF